MATNLRIDVWSDIACPWCWLGKRRLEVAIRRAPLSAAPDVVLRSFELEATPVFDRDHPGQSYAERLARSHGMSIEDAIARLERMRALAARDGIDLRFDLVRPTNLFDAHRVLQLALDHRLQSAVAERFFSAYLSEGALLSDHATLVRLAIEAGLDGETVRSVLASDIYDDEVREDELQAAELGIRGVPFYVIGGVYAIAGAQPVELLVEALSSAHEDIRAQAEIERTTPGHATNGSTNGAPLHGFARPR